MSLGSKITFIVLAGIVFSQSLVQEIMQQLSKPNNFYGDVAPLIAKMQAEAAPQLAQQSPPHAPLPPPPDTSDKK
jgi:hypothetical protein